MKINTSYLITLLLAIIFVALPLVNIFFHEYYHKKINEECQKISDEFQKISKKKTITSSFKKNDVWKIIIFLLIILCLIIFIVLVNKKINNLKEKLLVVKKGEDRQVALSKQPLLVDSEDSADSDNDSDNKDEEE